MMGRIMKISGDVYTEIIQMNKTPSVITQEMIEKLPMWAKHHMKQLARERDSANNHVQRLEDERQTTHGGGGEVKTRVSWEYMMEGAHPLPDQVHIRFHVGKGDIHPHQWITIRWREDDRVLDVSGSNGLIIYPRSANLVYITTEER